MRESEPSEAVGVLCHRTGSSSAAATERAAGSFRKHFTHLKPSSQSVEVLLTGVVGRSEGRHRDGLERYGRPAWAAGCPGATRSCPVKPGPSLIATSIPRHSAAPMNTDR